MALLENDNGFCTFKGVIGYNILPQMKKKTGLI